jgi:hypothetical protein
MTTLGDDEVTPYDPDEPLLPELDELPRRMLAGEPAENLLLDFHDLGELTPEEIEEGNRLGAAIDPDDDLDSGDVQGRRAAPPAGVLTAARSLAEALQDYGVKTSIELRTDAQGLYRVNRFVRNLSHHTVSRPSNGLTPCLNLVKVGRSDLSGPLCNGYGGYDLVARIITLGYANHSGLGGPWSVSGWGTVPRDNGRPYNFGWEFEGGYSDSWVGSLGEKMHDFMARCNAATLDWLGTLPGNPGPAPIACQGEHKTWAPGRKIDRYNYTTASGQALTAKARASKNPSEDDMPSAEEVADLVVKKLRAADMSPTTGTQSFENLLSQTHTMLKDLTKTPHERLAATVGAAEGEKLEPATALTQIRYLDANVRRLIELLEPQQPTGG